MAGLRKPKEKRFGADVAGVVEAVGRKVTRFKRGDAVFGSCKGAFAEYVCAGEPQLVAKADGVTFEQAACVPIAALTALQGLRDKGKIQAGWKVLINGAAGGVGTFAVQIAKSFDAEVTGVCSMKNLEMVRSIGANRTIDYTQEDFTKSEERYDLILDCVGNRPLLACRLVLKPKGTLVTAGGSAGRWMMRAIGRAIAAVVLSRFGSKKLVGVLAKAKEEDLETMNDLIMAGEVRPVIDRRYALREVPEAIRYLEEGHARGKVVITLE